MMALVKAQLSQWLGRMLYVVAAVGVFALLWGGLLGLGAVGDPATVERAGSAVTALRLGSLVPFFVASVFALAQVSGDRRWLVSESAYGAPVSAYLVSSVTVRIVPLGLTAFAGGVLSHLFVRAESEPVIAMAGGVWVHWTLGYIGTCLGLVVGLVVGRVREQVISLAVILLLCTMLGGVPTPVPNMPVAFVRDVVSGLSPVRWGTESMVLLNAVASRAPRPPTDDLRQVASACGKEQSSPFDCTVDGSGAVVAMMEGCTPSATSKCSVDQSAIAPPCDNFCSHVALGAPASPVDRIVGVNMSDPYRKALMAKYTKPKVPAKERGSAARAVVLLVAWGFFATMLLPIAAAIGLTGSRDRGRVGG
jgi:hypothetical protein